MHSIVALGKHQVLEQPGIGSLSRKQVYNGISSWGWSPYNPLEDSNNRHMSAKILNLSPPLYDRLLPPPWRIRCNSGYLPQRNGPLHSHT